MWNKELRHRVKTEYNKMTVQITTKEIMPFEQNT